MAQSKLTDIINDPDFGKLSKDEQHQVVSHFEPEFGKLSEDEKGQFIAGMVKPISPAGTMEYKKETARQQFEANKPVPTAGTVGQSIGEGAIGGLKAAATGIAGLSAHALSGNAAATVEDVKNLPGGIYHGAVDPVLNYVKALREKDPNAAGEAAGGIITGTLPAIYGAAEAAPSIAKAGVKGGARLLGATSESQMTRAANIKAAQTSVNIPASTAPAALGRAAINVTRPARAAIHEAVARLLAKDDTAPVIPNQPDQFQGRPGPPPETPPTQVNGLSSRPIAPRENVPPNLPVERNGIPGQTAEAINQPRPSPPVEYQVPEIPYLNRPQVQGGESFEYQSPIPIRNDIKMTNPPVADARLNRAKELQNFAYGGDPAVSNIEQGIAPSGREAQASTLKVAPKLAEDPILAKAKGLQFDQELFNKFKNSEAEVSAAEQSIPRTTSVPQQPIIDGIEKIISKYTELGEPEAAAAVAREWEKWADKGSSISWDDFLTRKRQFGKDLQTTGSWRETGTATDKAKAFALRDTYHVLMDSTSQLSERLQKANSSYSTFRDALSDAGMDFRTGRRFSRVGKEPPLPPFGQQ